MGGLCGTLNIRVEVTAPTGGDATLITVPTATVPSITFAASSLVANAGVYTCIVRAGYGTAFTTVVSSASATYTYVNCAAASFTSPWGVFLAG